jgi:hypothetical protein
MTKRRHKLNPSTVAKIQRDRRAGATYATLAKRYSLAEGSIRNALTKVQSAKPVPQEEAKHDPLVSAEPCDPPSQEDVRRWIGEQVAGLRVDAERLRAAGDIAGLATCNRALVAASSLLAKVTPAPVDSEVGVYVQTEVLRASQHAMRARIERTVAGAVAERATWPKCARCKQPTAPADYTPTERSLMETFLWLVVERTR